MRSRFRSRVSAGRSRRHSLRRWLVRPCRPCARTRSAGDQRARPAHQVSPAREEQCKRDRASRHVSHLDRRSRCSTLNQDRRPAPRSRSLPPRATALRFGVASGLIAKACAAFRSTPRTDARGGVERRRPQQQLLRRRAPPRVGTPNARPQRSRAHSSGRSSGLSSRLLRKRDTFASSVAS